MYTLKLSIKQYCTFTWNKDINLSEIRAKFLRMMNDDSKKRKLLFSQLFYPIMFSLHLCTDPDDHRHMFVCFHSLLTERHRSLLNSHVMNESLIIDGFIIPYKFMVYFRFISSLQN